MNQDELDANEAATERVCHDLNLTPTLPFPDALLRRGDVLRVDRLPGAAGRGAPDAARVLRPGGLVVITFSNRCFPTKAIHGWLMTDDEGHVRIVREYLRRTGGFAEAEAALCTPPGTPGDPLYAVWAAREAGS